MNLPQPKRDLPCTTCKGATTQTLIPTRSGCAWVCAACKTETPAFTHAQMRELLSTWTRDFPAATPPDPSRLPSTSNIKVYLDNGAEAPIELAPQFVEQHVRVTGELPKIGEPMYTTLKNLPPALCRVPYGKVVKIEHI